MEKLNKLLDYLQTIADTSYIATLMHWEMDITAPKKSLFAIRLLISSALNLYSCLSKTHLNHFDFV